jgi:hypothetical protein
MESIVLNEGAYKNPIEILTPAQVLEKIGKDFSVLRSDGKMDNVGWIVDKCLKKHTKHTENEYEVIVIKRERGIPITMKTIPLGLLKEWNTRAPVNKFKEIMNANQLIKYFGRNFLNLQRSTGEIEKDCWTALHCYQLDPRDSEDYFAVALIKYTAEHLMILKIVTLRQLKIWNRFPVIPSITQKMRPDFNDQLNELKTQVSKEIDMMKKSAK